MGIRQFNQWIVAAVPFISCGRITVTTPLPYIAAHIKKAQVVGCFGAYFMGAPLAVLIVPGNCIDLITTGIQM